jgi:hypothetical protein
MLSARPNPDITLQPRILDHYHAAGPFMEAHFRGDPIVFANAPRGLTGPDAFVDYGVTDVGLTMMKLLWLVHREYALSFLGWAPVHGDESHVRFARLHMSGLRGSANARLRLAAATMRRQLNAHDLDAALVLDDPHTFTLWIPLADQPHDVTVRDCIHRICNAALASNPELFTLEAKTSDPNRIHLGYGLNAYHRYTILPYSLYPGYDLPMATPVPWEALDLDVKIEPLTADRFTGFVALHGDAFTRDVERIGKQTLPHITKKKSTPPLESVETSATHGRIITAALAILEDGKPRTADELLEEALARKLLTSTTLSKNLSGTLVDYIARWMYRGRKPQIVQGADRRFRINEPPDDWPDLVKIATPPNDDAVDALVNRLKTTSRGEDPTAFEIACCDAFAHMGFRTQHVGGHANPDGIADAELGPLAYRVMMECKSALHFDNPKHTPSGVVYKPDVAEAAKYAPIYDADFSALVAPDYGDNQETMSELQEHKVTAFTVDDLATLLHIRANPLEVRAVLEPGFAMDKVADLVWERRRGRVKRLATIAYLIQKAGWASQVSSAADPTGQAATSPPCHAEPVEAQGGSNVVQPSHLGRNAPHITVDAAMLLVDQALRDLGKTQSCSREDAEAAFEHLVDPLVGSAVWLDDSHSALVLLSEAFPRMLQ